MFRPLLLWLDEKRWPQRLVGWMNRRRVRARLAGLLYRPTSHEGVHAVGLTVANPLLSVHALLNDFVPRSFGSWRDYRVLARVLGRTQAVAVLQDMRSGMEMSLVMPLHGSFPVKRFKAAKTIRLTREAMRAALVSVRDDEGRLLAAGVLEEFERAAYSRPWTGQRPGVQA